MNSNEHAIPVGDLVAEFLDAIEVATVFGVVSIHNISDAGRHRTSKRDFDS